MKSNFMITRFRSSFLPIVFLASVAPLCAAIYSANWNSGFTAGGIIPDGNPTGWSDSRNLVIPAVETITDVNVTLGLSGGWNGDLYAFLTHTGSPSSAILLNRPGRTAANSFGYADSMLTVTFDDTAANGDIHLYQNVTGFATSTINSSGWQPDGRMISPLTVVATDARTALLSVFNGLDASSGSWTLFAADLSTGERSTIQSWGLSISTVPEPGCGLFSALMVGMLLRRNRIPS